MLIWKCFNMLCYKKFVLYVRLCVVQRFFEYFMTTQTLTHIILCKIIKRTYKIVDFSIVWCENSAFQISHQNFCTAVRRVFDFSSFWRRIFLSPKRIASSRSGIWSLSPAWPSNSLSCRSWLLKTYLSPSLSDSRGSVGNTAARRHSKCWRPKRGRPFRPSTLRIDKTQIYFCNANFSVFNMQNGNIRDCLCYNLRLAWLPLVILTCRIRVMVCVSFSFISDAKVDTVRVKWNEYRFSINDGGSSVFV